jgi:hypothetical protein
VYAAFFGIEMGAAAVNDAVFQVAAQANRSPLLLQALLHQGIKCGRIP